jgi:hypothetical protein
MIYYRNEKRQNTGILIVCLNIFACPLSKTPVQKMGGWASG